MGGYKFSVRAYKLGKVHRLTGIRQTLNRDQPWSLIF